MDERESKEDRIMRLAKERCESGQAVSLSEARRWVMANDRRLVGNSPRVASGHATLERGGERVEDR